MNLIQDVINLEVFDAQGRLITKIKTVRKGDLKYRPANPNSDEEASYLYIEDVLLNLSMLEQLGNRVVNKESDFEESLNKNKETVIKFNAKGKTSELKLIGSGIIYDAETAKVSHDFRIVMPKVELIPSYDLNLETGSAHLPSYVFKLNPYNAEDDLFDVRITKRD